MTKTLIVLCAIFDIRIIFDNDFEDEGVFGVRRFIQNILTKEKILVA